MKKIIGILGLILVLISAFFIVPEIREFMGSSPEESAEIKNDIEKSKDYTKENREIKNDDKRTEASSKIKSQKKRANSSLNLDNLPEMIHVKGGTFIMGCTPEPEVKCYLEHEPPHSVTLSDFYMGKYEVTNQQFVDFLNANINIGEDLKKWYRMGGILSQIEKDDNKCRPKSGYENHPVMSSWFGAKAYCEWVNKSTGKKYRLPTEAEWEYAARGGNLSLGRQYAAGGSRYYTDSVAWYSRNSNRETHEVGMKKSNEIGLYDMSGNLSEWCADWYSDWQNGTYYANSPKNDPQGPSNGSSRVLRGGNYNDNAYKCSVFSRIGTSPTQLYHGFRIASTTQ